MFFSGLDLNSATDICQPARNSLAGGMNVYRQAGGVAYGVRFSGARSLTGAFIGRTPVKPHPHVVKSAPAATRPAQSPRIR